MSFVAGVTEVGLLIAGMLILCVQSGLSGRDAVLAALILVPAGLSCLFQICFLAGAPSWSLGFEAAAVCYAIYLLLRQRALLRNLLAQVAAVARQAPLVFTALGLCLLGLAAQALLLPEGNVDSLRYNLARVLLFEQERSLFLQHITEYHQAAFPVGGDILAHLFLRFHTDYGVGLFSFIAFLAIISGTYALARRYGARPQALAAAMVIAGMPLVIYQATGTKPDILAAAIALFCLSAWYRLCDGLTVRDVALLIVGLCFGISAKTTFLAFAVPAICCFTFVLTRRHGLARCLTIIRLNKKGWLLAGLALAILFPGWLFLWNLRTWGHWAGPPDFILMHQQIDGMSGAEANLVRYVLQSIHFLMPFDWLSEKLMGVPFTKVLEAFYDRTVDPRFGKAGIAAYQYSFAIDWSDSENGAWFGPFSMLLGWPAVAWALRRGAAELRATAWSMLGYLALVCWQVGWMPYNCRFFTLWYVCAGPLIASFLSHVQWRLWALKALQWGGVGILFYGCCANQQKPIFYRSSWRADRKVTNIYTKTDWGRDRQYWSRFYFKDDRIEEFRALIPAHARVGLASGGNMLVFPYMSSRPDLTYIPMLPGESVSGHNFDYLVCDRISASKCAAKAVGTAGRVLWETSPDHKGQKGAVIQIQAETQGEER